MKKIELIIWQHRDRVITPNGPGTVTGPPNNPWAARPPVVVRLDVDGLEWEFAAYDLTPENPEELTKPQPRPCAHVHPAYSAPGEPLACGPCNYCHEPYPTSSIPGVPITAEEEDALITAINAAWEAHKSHRSGYRRDPDGFHRCRECYPAPPAAQLPDVHEVPCPGGTACQHPAGHVHLEYDRHGQVWGSEGQLLDPFDLTRDAMTPSPLGSARHERTVLPAACYEAPFGRVHVRPACRCAGRR